MYFRRYVTLLYENMRQREPDPFLPPGLFPGGYTVHDVEVRSNSVAEAVERIAASQTFVRASRAVRLLRRVVELELAGRGSEIKEYSLAQDVFDRQDYDPKVDSMVRVEAGRLRKLLTQYYGDEGKDEAVRIEILKGSYIPRITGTPDAGETLSGQRFPIRRVIGLAAATLVLSGLCIWAWAGRHKPPPRYPATGHLALAVLPFADLSPAKDQSHISDGITEELIEALSTMDRLRVAARTSVFAYKGRDKDVREIGQDLKVGAVLEGSVRQQGSRLRITVQLISTEDGFHLWSETFDREIGDVLQIERDIATRVAKTFNVELRETTRALVRPRTRNPEAWQYYLRAAALFGADDPTVSQQAIELFKQAVASDPNYAMAWSKLARALTLRVEWGLAQGVDTFPVAAHAANRAVALDPNLAEAHFATALVKIHYEHDWKAAEQEFRRAIELDPNDGSSRLEFARLVLTTDGRYTEAIEQLERCLAIDSGEVRYRDALASVLIKAGRCHEADEHLAVARKIASASPGPLVYQGLAAECQGHYETALARYKEAAEVLRSGWVLSHLAGALLRTGRREEALRVLTEMQQPSGAKPIPYLHLATIYAELGDKSRALDALEQAYETSSSLLLWLKVEPSFRGLRSEPRFIALVKKLGFAETLAVQRQ